MINIAAACLSPVEFPNLLSARKIIKMLSIAVKKVRSLPYSQSFQQVAANYNDSLPRLRLRIFGSSEVSKGLKGVSLNYITEFNGSKADSRSVPQEYKQSFTAATNDIVDCLQEVEYRRLGERMSIEDTVEQQQMKGEQGSVELHVPKQTEKDRSNVFEDVSAAEDAQC